MTSYNGLNGQVYQVDDQAFAFGGEGKICAIVSDGNDNLLAKLFRPGMEDQALLQKAAKLTTMVQIKKDTTSQNIAWPLDVLMDSNRVVRGFVMRRMPNTVTMAETVSSKTFNSWRKRLILAANLCDVVGDVHALGQVIGDMQPQNFGVDRERGYCYAFDADSFHIKDAQGRYHPCTVGLAEYFAPELQAKMKQGLKITDLNPADTFSQQTDLFALGVLLFQILFMGFHPFTGRVVATADSSVFMSTSENIRKLRSPYFNPPPGMASPFGAPPIDILPASIRVLFHNALLTFDRPTAQEWRREIIRLIGSLSVCGQGHEYYQGLERCPWCAPESVGANRPAGKPSVPEPQAAASQAPATILNGQQKAAQKSDPDDRPLWKRFVYSVSCISFWLLWTIVSMYSMILFDYFFLRYVDQVVPFFYRLVGTDLYYYIVDYLPIIVLLSIPCLISGLRPPKYRGKNVLENMYHVLMANDGRYGFSIFLTLLASVGESSFYVVVRGLLFPNMILAGLRLLFSLSVPKQERRKRKRLSIVRGGNYDH